MPWYLPILFLYFMQDGFRVLSCSKDYKYSIRVYKWVWSDVTTPQLLSRYQLLGGSVALKKQWVYQDLKS